MTYENVQSSFFNTVFRKLLIGPTSGKSFLLQYITIVYIAMPAV